MNRTSLIVIALAAVTVGTYGQVARFDFVTWDDPTYVTRNDHVRAGVTAEGLRWALTNEHAGNWHPLTGLSHMLDCQLFGLDPAGHHLTNALLHVLNTLLLFGVLRALTAAFWPSALVAALFALHPLHVEPVAWVSGRKDVLSTFFGLLAMYAYGAYARRGGTARYGLAAVLLALGLMAKPMLVTMPAVFLLLDYWPLGRLHRRALSTLLIEKLPFVALSMVSAVLTFIMQHRAGAIQTTATVPVDSRLANALVSYVRYVGKTLWPRELSILYPHPSLPGGTPLEVWQVAGAAILLLLVSWLVWSSRRPYAVVGWLWYLIMLVPVSGIVQIGDQAMADRYCYMPLIGLFILVAWGLAELASHLPGRSEYPLRLAIGTGTALVLLLNAAGSVSQARHWRDSRSLYVHALRVAPRSPVIHNNLGHLLHGDGMVEDAIRHYRQALEVRPNYADARTNLGIALQARGQLDEAIVHYRASLRSRPDAPIVHNNLGYALQATGRPDEAIHHYEQALRLQPSDATVHRNLAIALHTQGRLDEAIAHYRAVTELQPDSAKAYNNLGYALQARGKLDDAVHYYRLALRLEPGYELAQRNLASARALQGSLD